MPIAVQKEQICGKAARFIYDKVVDRDLIVISDNIDKLLAGTPECEKCQFAISDDGVLKLSQLLGRGEACLDPFFECEMLKMRWIANVLL